MKKFLLLFLFAIGATSLHSQEKADFYSLMYHEIPGCFYNHNGLIQQRDGALTLSSYVFANNSGGIPLGNALYKISPTTLTITDSLFIANTSMSYYWLAQNPYGEGNTRINLEYHEDCDSSFLRIGLFTDDDLQADCNEDVIVPVCLGYAYGEAIVDSRGDIILQYSKETDPVHYNEFAARFGFDGTLKTHALVLENQQYGVSQIQVLKESPLKYYQWGEDGSYLNNLIVYVLDSLFNTNPIIINSILKENVVDPNHTVYDYLFFDSDTQVIPIGEDVILVAAEYVSDTNFNSAAEYGVAVVKYDLRTMQQKGYVLFDDHTGGHNGQAQCMDIKKMSDGTVYFIYKENGYPAESVQIVKMDTDLNMDWKRFCKTDNINIYPLYGHSILYEDEQVEEQGMAWLGGGRATNSNHGDNLVLFLLTHDGPVGLENYGIEVRPYAFYPNPAKDRLRMEFSPDVQPAQVELYDLQGRLVGTQRSNFEDIDVGQLPAGTYTLRVTMEDGNSYSDKVLKE